MLKTLFISNSKIVRLMLGILIAFVAVILISFITDHIISTSDFRLAYVYEGKPIEQKNIFAGNSRAVPFNNFTLETDNTVYNIAYDGMGGAALNSIINAISKNASSTNKKSIFIEVTTIGGDSIPCDYHLFQDAPLFPKEKIRDKCPRQYWANSIFPTSKINTPIFFRVLYNYLLPSRDQSWHKAYPIPEVLCKTVEKSDFTALFESEEYRNSIGENLQKVLNKHKNPNIIIKFFLTPILGSTDPDKKWASLDKRLSQELGQNYLPLHSKINSSFLTDCSNFADRVHLSASGAKKISSFLNLSL